MSDLTTPSQTVQALVNPRQDVPAMTMIEWIRSDLMDSIQSNLFGSILRDRRIRECWNADRFIQPYDISSNGRTALNYGECDRKPWAGALDHDVRVVDGQINEEVDLALLAMFRSEKIVRPRDAMNDDQATKALAWKHALEFYLDTTKAQLLTNLELFANSVSETGKAVWYTGWKSQWRKGRKTMKWDEVVEAAIQQTMGMMKEQMGMMPEDEMPEDMAFQMSQQISDSLDVLRFSPDMMGELQMKIAAVDPALVDPKELKKVAQAFSKGEAEADYFAPIKQTSVPTHRAYLIGVDCFFPAMSRVTQDNEDAVPRMAFVDWYTEARIRTESKQNNWNPKFTEQVLKFGAGLAFDFAGWSGNNTWSGGSIDGSGWALNGYDMGMSYNTESLRNAGLYQIVTLWFWGVGDDGLPAPFKTILHPVAAPNECAYLECDPDKTGKMPYIIKTRNLKRTMILGATGVPNEMFTNQLARKKLEDAIISQTELRAMPPMKETTERSGNIRPGARLTVSNRHVGKDGDMFLDVPDISGGSLEVLKWLKQEQDDYYLSGGNVDPDAKRSRRFVQLFKWTSFYEQMINLMCLNIQQSGEDINVGSVAGNAVNWKIKNQDLQGEIDVVVRMDEASIDVELAQEKLDFIIKLLPLNTNGTLKNDAIIKHAISVIWPELLASGIDTQADAADRITKDENNRIAQMNAGVQPNWSQQADAPQVRMAALQAWAQLPSNVQKAQIEPAFGKMLETEQQWIKFAIDQQITNPATGRAGVDVGKVNEELQTDEE